MNMACKDAVEFLLYRVDATKLLGVNLLAARGWVEQVTEPMALTTVDIGDQRRAGFSIYHNRLPSFDAAETPVTNAVACGKATLVRHCIIGLPGKPTFLLDIGQCSGCGMIFWSNTEREHRPGIPSPVIVDVAAESLRLGKAWL